jgi:UDP-N-acetylmuramate--alanine ligase
VKGARHIVLCADDANANALSTPSSTEVVRYGIVSPDARLVARDVSSVDATTAFEVVYDDERLGRVELRVPGRHNVLNALAAIGSGLVLGAELPSMARGLAEFVGAERRFQRLGDAAGVTVVDDYAHHPTEIAATLAAARTSFPGRRLVVAFQPHLYSRTRDFAPEFGASLATADAVFLTEIYPAREKPIEGVSSTLVESALRQSGGHLQWRGRRDELANALAAFVREGDAVITLGAGDITKTGGELLARLASPAA